MPFVRKIGYLCKESYKNPSILPQKMFSLTFKGNVIQNEYSQQDISAPNKSFYRVLLCFRQILGHFG